MTENLHKPPHDIERFKLQNQLAAIDRDADKLQDFIAELYTTHPDNPQILYAAASHLTALTYLDRRDSAWEPQLPEAAEAQKAFGVYARLMAMLENEKSSPRYADDERIQGRFIGTREELAFLATLTYATAQGADFVALPSPAELDFMGADEASDVLVFFPQAAGPALEIQVTTRPQTKKVNAYHPRIPILSLAKTLGNSSKATELRGLIRSVGEWDDSPDSPLQLPEREHTILLSGAGAILSAAQAWLSERADQN